MQTMKSKKCYSQMSLPLTAELVRAFQAKRGKDSLPHLRGAASWSTGSATGKWSLRINIKRKLKSHCKGLGSFQKN